MFARVLAIARHQTAIGLAIAITLIAAWLAIHVWAIFGRDWTLADVPLALLVILVQAWLSTGLFITAHDAMHGSLAPGRPALNRAIGTLCLGIYAGLSYAALLPKHHAHHRHSGTADDPDFNPTNARAVGAWFVRFFLGYYTHAQIARITIVALGYLALGASLLHIALFWAVPALLALGQLFVFGTYLPHRHEGDGGFADKHNARSRRTSALGSLLGCFHFGGYHHEHHLNPGTPWWRLPTLTR